MKSSSDHSHIYLIIIYPAFHYFNQQLNAVSMCNLCLVCASSPCMLCSVLLFQHMSCVCQFHLHVVFCVAVSTYVLCVPVPPACCVLCCCFNICLVCASSTCMLCSVLLFQHMSCVCQFHLHVVFCVAVPTYVLCVLCVPVPCCVLCCCWYSDNSIPS